MGKKQKSTRKKKKPAATKSAATKRAARAVTKDGGPVTLAEAKALVQAQSPQRARRTVAVVATATPETVGAEREKLDEQRREEIERRVRQYTAVMKIMKQRGVRGIAAKAAQAPKRPAPLAAAAGGQPLQILAEGDSWFDYPVPFFGGGVIPRLEARLGVPILNLAKAGDEVRNIMGVEQREVLAKYLKDGCPAGGQWDVLLFSGGGNDIVGNPMALWVNDYKSSVPPAKLINQPRFDAALSLVRAVYEDLIALRDELSPRTHLVFHAYDFAIPDGRGVCHFGPWLKPTFTLRKFPTRGSAAFEVVKAMLQQFAKLLESLEKPDSVTFIHGQGTLEPRTSSWHNELHPSKGGFNKFADVFHEQLKSLFPNRVL